MTATHPTNNDIIGYANARDCMVSLPPQSAHEGPITLEPLKPIVSRGTATKADGTVIPAGHLTGYQPLLETYVKTGILRRIMKGDHVFARWDELYDRKNAPKLPPAPEVKSAKYAEQPRVNISSERGIEVINQQTNAEVTKKKMGRPPKAKPVEPEPQPPLQEATNEPVEINGEWWVGEKNFPSKAAAVAFIKLT